MTELCLIKATDGEFQVSRSDLEKHDYFHAMLQHNPPFLTLPFPSRIVEDIVGVIQHGEAWTCSGAPNVRLALTYCHLNLAPDEFQETLRVPFHDGRMRFTFIGNKQTMMSLIIPATSPVSITVTEAIRHQSLLRHHRKEFYLVFHPIEGDRYQLDPRCLDRINQNEIITVEVSHYHGERKGQAEIVMKNKPST